VGVVTFQFGPYSLNSDTRQLLADGAEVHLSPKAFALLLLLIENRDRAMSKAELQDRLWPSTFIGETNLATLAAEIRRALGDAARGSAYVRTVHRYGYRFVATVSMPAPGPARPAGGPRMYVRTADRQFPLSDGTTTIGRGSDASIQIDAAGVSRHHARILVADGRASIEDLGSKNGTFVGGDRLESARWLADGDEIRVGPVVVTFKIAPATEATEKMK